MIAAFGVDGAGDCRSYSHALNPGRRYEFSTTIPSNECPLDPVTLEGTENGRAEHHHAESPPAPERRIRREAVSRPEAQKKHPEDHRWASHKYGFPSVPTRRISGMLFGPRRWPPRTLRSVAEFLISTYTPSGQLSSQGEPIDGLERTAHQGPSEPPLGCSVDRRWAESLPGRNRQT
jgi:hypothetical protein